MLIEKKLTLLDTAPAFFLKNKKIFFSRNPSCELDLSLLTTKSLESHLSLSLSKEEKLIHSLIKKIFKSFINFAWNKNILTAHVNKDLLEINPLFWLSLSDKSKVLLLRHEALHHSESHFELSLSKEGEELVDAYINDKVALSELIFKDDLYSQALAIFWLGDKIELKNNQIKMTVVSFNEIEKKYQFFYQKEKTLLENLNIFNNISMIAV